MDGVMIGHPCCSVHDCPNPLESIKNHFCAEHMDNNKICAVTLCYAWSENGYCTCEAPNHRAAEVYLHQKGHIHSLL
jgi:hypothetical protein